MNVKVQSRYGYEVEIRRRKSYTESLEAEAFAAQSSPYRRIKFEILFAISPTEGIVCGMEINMQKKGGG